MACPYCINKFTGVNRKRRELTTREWIIALNNIDTGGRPLTIGGGEPTMRNDFFDILNGLRSDLRVDLLTNGMFSLKEFMSKTTPERFYKRDAFYKAIRFSYHAGATDEKDIVEKSVELQKAGYAVGIFGLNHPQNLYLNVAMTQKCVDAGIYFFVRDFLGFYQNRLYGTYRYPEAINGNRKCCLCRIEDFLIGPEGNVYRCHKDLYEGIGEIGSILNIAYEINDGFLPCDNYGLCSPCDVKQKLNPDLITSKSSVEIKELS
jgi:MoaA/NifB/PqqE/SkfB family radical SAM enzyme